SREGEHAAAAVRRRRSRLSNPVQSFVTRPLQRLLLSAIRATGIRVGAFYLEGFPPPGTLDEPPLGPKWEPLGPPYPDQYGDPVQEYTSRTGRTYREAAGLFLAVTVPALEDAGDPDGVRVVFWFN
ncbi:hypothetical protein, partial [Rubrivirga sp.]|uniref:hypothetical protein n=1 Tax=Rubrivirga sp. TaxID=1885344 RepID=UPI003C77D1C3